MGRNQSGSKDIRRGYTEALSAKCLVLMYFKMRGIKCTEAAPNVTDSVFWLVTATRTGGYVNVDFVFDGKTLSVSNKDANDFVQLEAPGSADQIIDLLREKHGLTAPGADLLLSDAYDVMTATLSKARISARASLTVSSATTWHSGMWTLIGRSGSKPALVRSRANT